MVQPALSISPAFLALLGALALAGLGCQGHAPKDQTVWVFDIRDMLIQPDRNIRSPVIARSDIEKGKSATDTGSLFTDNDTETLSPDEVTVREIIACIKAQVAPESWRDAGGQIGSIREINGQLIVNQTPENQRAVRKLLQELRGSRQLELKIEKRASEFNFGGFK